MDNLNFPHFFGLLFICQFETFCTFWQFPAIFWSYIYLSICNFPHFLTGKQKTKKCEKFKLPLLVCITISYIFCALHYKARKVYFHFSWSFRFRWLFGFIASRQNWFCFLMLFSRKGSGSWNTRHYYAH